MLTNLLFFLILTLGAVAGIAFSGRRFEEVLPIGAIGIVLILFVTGLFGIPLHFGSIAVILLYVVLAGYGLLRVGKRQDMTWRGFFTDRLLTPAFFIFLVIFLGLSYLNDGRLATGWDEFTHWMDSVKAMTVVDDFTTNPNSGSMFYNYPPGMSLFQLFLQHLYLFTHPGGSFNEWRVYFAYQVLFVSILLPFLKDLTWKRPLELILLPLTLLLALTLIFHDLYMSLYIDAFLGILAGVGMAFLFVKKELELVDCLYLGLLLFLLTLAKDAGILLSLFVALTYVLLTWASRRKIIFVKTTGFKDRCLTIFPPLLMLLASYLPRALWMNEVRISGGNSPSVPVRFGDFLGILFWGKEDLETHREEVVQNFAERFTGWTLPIGNLLLSYAWLTVLGLALAVLMIVCYEKGIRKALARYSFVVLMTFLMLAVYVLGLGALYISRFTDYEASYLASYDRYMNIGYMALAVFLILCTVYALERLRQPVATAAEALLLLFTVSAGPTDYMRYFLTRENVEVSISWRSPYQTIANQIEQLLPEDARIYMVAQESYGEEGVVFHYVLRPREIKKIASLGGPYSEGDVYSLDLTPEEWMDKLVEKYDNVIIFRLNDGFVERYSELFENPDDIVQGAFFTIDRENRRLVRIE